jgi:16S rRNA G966 N2-methylase RsmD
MLEDHPLAALIPSMRADDYAALRDDIAANGLLQPIVIYEHKILDGRHRYRACVELGIEPRTVVYDGDAPLAYVVSANLARRHLTADQRAVLAVRLKEPLAEEARRRQQEAGQYGALGAPYGALGAPYGALGGRGHRREDRTAVDGAEGAEKPPLVSKLIQGGVPAGPTGTRSTRTQQNLAALAGVSTGYIAYADYIDRHAPEAAERIMRGDAKLARMYKQLRVRMARERALAAAQRAPENGSRWHIWHADLRTWQAPRTYQWIITDPPYPADALDLWEVLAQRAAEWLAPGGMLVAMSGLLYLPHILHRLCAHLDYYWLAAYLHEDTPSIMQTRLVNAQWKPLLCFVKRGDRYAGRGFGDLFRSLSREKDDHDWQQSISGMSDIVSRLCRPGEWVLDPFAGTGTTGIAALRHGCFFHGIDVDAETVQIARKRLSDEDHHDQKAV